MAPVLSLTFDRDGLVVVRRENGRTTDLVTLSEALSASVAAHIARHGAPEPWLAAILSVAESLADQLIEHCGQRAEILH